MNLNHVYFEIPGGETLRPYEDYGVYLKTYAVTPPAARTHFVTIEGRDGDLDLSEWAGAVRYDSRELTVSLRDMNGNADALIAALNGRRVNIRFDDAPHRYYTGRCTDVKTDPNTRHRVCDIDLTFSCDPWRLADAPTVVTATLSGTAITLLLSPLRKPVIPTMTVTTGPCVLTVGEDSATYQAGTYALAGLTLTGPTAVSVSGTGAVKFTWTDGDF